MTIISQPAELATKGRNVCVAIGVFDGVHLGHQQILRQMIEDARRHDALAVVTTFDCHPSSVVAPDRAPRLIYPLRKKLETIATFGAAATWLIRFDEAFSQQGGEAFTRSLVRGFGRIQSLCVGTNFQFGHRRSGNVELLRALSGELNFTLHAQAAVTLDGEVVSSTRIREHIRSGNLAAASRMLGRAYALAGTVRHGDQLGRKLGFPTANLDVTGLELPPSGVYAVRVKTPTGTHVGALNIGFRPTVAQPQPSLQVEVHLLDFNGDLYGQELELTFAGKLREEKKFPSIGDLQEQIRRDIAAARQTCA